MSTAVISYSSLRDAESEAKSVSKKLSQYAKGLNSAVYKKLNDYNGSYTRNISNAKNKTSAKIRELEARANAYKNYADDIRGLREKCMEVDKTVKTKVSQLTADFKAAHGIRNSKIENAINYGLTGLKNSTAAGRWLGNQLDKGRSVQDYIKQSIEDWWDYEGGKQWAKGVAIGALEVAIGVCTIVGAIAALVAGGTILAMVAAVASLIVGVIGAVNGLMNIWNEDKALGITRNGDPATGRRRSNVNSWQDYLRSSFVYGDDGEKYEYNDTLYQIAKGIDIVNLVCNAIGIVNGVGKLIKKGYKWVIGTPKGLTKIKTGWKMAADGLKDGFAAMKKHNWDFFKNGLITFKKNFSVLGKGFLDNLKEHFGNFDSVKEGASSVKHILGAGKDFLKEGDDVKDILKNTFKNFVLPGITVIGTTTSMGTGKDGQMYIDFDTKKIVMDDIWGVWDKMNEKIIKSPLFSGNSIMTKETMEVLSKSCDVRISIPDIYIPTMTQPVLNPVLKPVSM